MKPYETKKCINCEREFEYTNGNPYKKYCDNKCQNNYQNKNGLRTKSIPYTKEFLEELYLTNKISVLKISKQLTTSISQVSRWLKKYDISTRDFSTKGLKVSLGMKRSVKTRKNISESKKGNKNYN